MKCQACNSDMICEVKDYHYTESGLDNVILVNMDVYTCGKCGETAVNIPIINELHTVLGKKLIAKEALLEGPEIRFLRKNIGLSATKLAEIMGTNNATVSRWESGAQTISKENDHLLRLVYAGLKGISQAENKTFIETSLSKIKPIHQRGDDLNIYPWMWTKAQSACHAA